MLEWQNKGLNLWTIEETSSPISLVKSTATYDIATGTIGLLDVVLRTDDGSTTLQSDYLLNLIAEPTYANIPNKLTEARPLQYYFQRKEILDITDGVNQNSTITLWPIPDETGKYKVYYWRVKRISDVGDNAANTMQVPGRFLPSLVAGLAYQIAAKRPEAAGRVSMLKQIYDETFKEAADEDRVKTSARFVPGLSYY